MCTKLPGKQYKGWRVVPKTALPLEDDAIRQFLANENAVTTKAAELFGLVACRNVRNR
jgi:hypothetical protein